MLKKTLSVILRLISSAAFWLVLIMIGAFWIRLYKIDNPIADWHSWRQADTAAVARNFYKDGFNPFLPRGDDMSTINESFLPNPDRLRMVEFPIYSSIVYFTYLVNGGVDEKLARGVSVIFSLGSIALMYLIVAKYFGKFLGVLSAAVFAFLPYNIYYSRVTLPEPSFIFFSLGMFYVVDRWIREDKLWQFLVGSLLTIAAFLTKPTAVFFLLPLVVTYFQTEKKWYLPKWRYLLFLVLCATPILAWRWWVGLYPEGVPNSRWLFNGDGIRFKPAFWRWILADRFGREILSVVGSVLFFIGLLIAPKPKESPILHFLALSSFLYVIIFATGNVTHDYYQTLLVPVLAIFVARGLVLMLEGGSGFVSRLWTIPFGLLFFGLMFYFGWFEVKGLYQINNGAIVDAGREVDRVLPKNAIVLAPYNRDSAFLYQTNRHGFAIQDYPISEMINKYHVSFYASTAKDTRTKWIMDHYTVIEDKPTFVILDLTKPNPKPTIQTSEPG